MSAHGGFTIKVSDILHNLGVKDTLNFSNKFSTFLPQLQQPGISFLLTLTSLSNEQLMVEATSICVPFQSICDYCGKDFNKEFTLDTITTKAYIGEIDNDQFEISIDKKNKTIDIEKWLTENIIIELPVVNMCKDCQNKSEDQNDESIDLNPIKRKKV